MKKIDHLKEHALMAVAILIFSCVPIIQLFVAF